MRFLIFYQKLVFPTSKIKKQITFLEIIKIHHGYTYDLLKKYNTCNFYKLMRKEFRFLIHHIILQKSIQSNIASNQK